MKKDVCIIGGGAAGLSASVFAARRGLSTVIVAKDLGGQTSSTAEIENYPGVGRIEGADLIARFADEARGFGCEIILDEIVSVEPFDDSFRIQGIRSSYEALSVVLAFGKTPRDIGAVREKDFFGKGVSALTVPIPQEVQGTSVAVVGGGNSALDAAARLASVAARVYLIHRRDDFRGEQVLVDRISTHSRIIKKTPFIVREIGGQEHVSSITIEHAESGAQEVISVDFVFPAVGFEPRAGFVKDLVTCDESGHIIIDQFCATNVQGIFAAGDSTTVPYQQIIISAGEGAKAALSAYHFLQKKFGKRAVKTDWGFIATE